MLIFSPVLSNDYFNGLKAKLLNVYLLLVFHKSYQFLSETWWGPVIGDGVESRIFTGDYWIGDDHVIPFVDPKSISSFNLSCEKGIARFCQQSSHLPVVFGVRGDCMLRLTAMTVHAGLSVHKSIEGYSEYGLTKLEMTCCSLGLLCALSTFHSIPFLTFYGEAGQTPHFLFVAQSLTTYIHISANNEHLFVSGKYHSHTITAELKVKTLHLTPWVRFIITEG